MGNWQYCTKFTHSDMTPGIRIFLSTMARLQLSLIGRWLDGIQNIGNIFVGAWLCKADYVLTSNSPDLANSTSSNFDYASTPKLDPSSATSRPTDFDSFRPNPSLAKQRLECAHLYIPGIVRCWDLYDTLFGLRVLLEYSLFLPLLDSSLWLVLRDDV